MKKYTITIASAPDRENLVAEVWEGNKMIAEITQEDEKINLNVYVLKSPIQLDYDSFLQVIIEGRAKLKKTAP